MSGAIWLPAKVELNGRIIHVSTAEWKEEFQIRHSRRYDSKTVHLTGYNKNVPRRRTIRFSRDEDAESALSAILGVADVTEVHQLPPPEGAVPVGVQNMIPKITVIVFAPMILGPLALVFLALRLGPGAIPFLFITASSPYIVRAILLMIDRSNSLRPENCWLRKPSKAWLRLRNGYLMLAYLHYENYSWAPLKVRRLEWLDSLRVIARTNHGNFILSFSKEEEAGRVIDGLNGEVEVVVGRGRQGSALPNDTSPSITR